MSGVNKGNGNGKSAGSSGTGGSSPTAPDSGLERTLRRLLKKLPEGYSACIEKSGRVVVACTDLQLAELQKSSKARIYVRREGDELKATKVTSIDQ